MPLTLKQLPSSLALVTPPFNLYDHFSHIQLTCQDHFMRFLKKSKEKDSAERMGDQLENKSFVYRQR